MKLTKAEYRLLDALNDVGMLEYAALKPSVRAMVQRLRNRGLISKRHFWRGTVTMTMAGRRSHSYGPR